MQEQAPLPVRKRSGQRGSGRRPPGELPPMPPPSDPLSRQDKQKIFKGMVVGELEAGFLRYSRREALLRYAAKLGIPEFQATLLIAEAQFHSDQIEPIHFDTAATLESITRFDAWSVPMRLAFALTGAVFIDLLLIYWLFG